MRIPHNISLLVYLFITVLITRPTECLGWIFPWSKGGDGYSKRAKNVDTPKVSLLVEIPMSSSVHYDKPLDVKAGGRFLLETPMERYAYSSAGKSNLHRVNIAYLMQSMYRPNLVCFFLHFWSMKDPGVPWDVPHLRIPPPPWSRYYNPPYY